MPRKKKIDIGGLPPPEAQRAILEILKCEDFLKRRRDAKGRPLSLGQRSELEGDIIKCKAKLYEFGIRESEIAKWRKYFRQRETYRY